MKIKRTERFVRIWLVIFLVVITFFSVYSIATSRQRGLDLISKPETENEAIDFFYFTFSLVIVHGILSFILTLIIVFVGNAYLEVKRNSLTDALTNLYNKRYFYRILYIEIKRAKRFMHPLSLLVIDLDNFKKYNDKFGHHAGDKLLRNIDTVARFGGEEFTILLPEASHSEAVRVAERIRKNIQHSKSGEIDVTASIGLATYDGKSEITEKVLFKEADELLYQAKKAGKNVVKKRILN